MCALDGLECLTFHLDIASSGIVVGNVDRVAVRLVLADGHLCRGRYVGLEIIEVQKV